MNVCHIKNSKARSQPEIQCPNDAVIEVDLFRKVQLQTILMAISTPIGAADDMLQKYAVKIMINVNKSKHATWQSSILPEGITV